MDILISAVIGVLTGVIATWAFWRTLLWQQPSLDISNQVSVEVNPITGRKEFRFKVFNSGKNQVTNIKVNAWLCDLLNVPGGTVARGVHHLPLPNSETLTLCPPGKEDRPWGLPPERAFVTSPDIDVEEFLSKENHRIMLAIRFSDAITGTTVVKQVTYTKRELIYGSFALGGNLDVLPAEG